MNETEQMEAAGFEYDPTWYSGRRRWTHTTTGTTALRQPYMDDAQWEAHKLEKIAEAQEQEKS